jgi:hypothetical protein
MGVVLLMAGLAIWAIYQSSIARSEARRAEVNEKTAESERQHAETEREQAETQRRRAEAYLYDADMNFAGQALQQNNLGAGGSRGGAKVFAGGIEQVRV